VANPHDFPRVHADEDGIVDLTTYLQETFDIGDENHNIAMANMSNGLYGDERVSKHLGAENELEGDPEELHNGNNAFVILEGDDDMRDPGNDNVNDLEVDD
jgi:hypothetical protein